MTHTVSIFGGAATPSPHTAGFVQCKTGMDNGNKTEKSRMPGYCCLVPPISSFGWPVWLPTHPHQLTLKGHVKAIDCLSLRTSSSSLARY
jgi:hypothetical protein